MTALDPHLPPPQPEAPGDASSLSIAEVERETGLSKDTLRVWERRYGFPKPARDAAGERRYDVATLRRLRLVRRLLDAGRRPGGVVALPEARLRDLCEQPVARAARGPRPAPAPRTGGTLESCWLAWVQANETDALRRAMQQHLMKRGLAATVDELVAPLSVQVGEAWLAGRVSVFQEHAYSEVVQTVFREAMATIDSTRAGEPRTPRVLLTTLAGERHGLGLLMAECFLALEGAERLPLGPGTPLDEVAEAARQLAVDVVALSFSAHCAPRGVVHDLRTLRDRLPASVEIWAGGASPGLLRVPRRAGVDVLGRASDLSERVARWRAERGARR